MTPNELLELLIYMHGDSPPPKPNPGPKVKCNHCGDVIQSTYRHDFKYCGCKTIAVDGGGDYLKMTFKNSPEDFTVLKNDPV